ncbi:MmgE/PrpD family protein [Labrys monachus]|uniref:2-methylcitrate dehydratase PrpD n=1 Tax=Labrys monachus TaxID=217067 RepID=A0ABU0F9T2_9HYPH|nr:MmgE/PrpD family protein [Labrys monachus]MDQ0391377.1 2-methylcitrate dehydratase PrpD [Labrys monachus]
MTAFETLADFIRATSGGSVPPGTRHQAGIVLADTLGAILAGWREPEVAAICARYADAGSARVFGLGRRADAASAAFLTGFAGTAVELDEGNYAAGGHPAIHAVAAALAEWSTRPAVSGEEFLDAVLVGYEAGARTGMATRLRPAVHPHGTWGVIGAAAAVAKLRGFDSRKTLTALELAASLSLATSVTASVRGSAIRNIYAGVAAQNGLLACDLAEAGMSGEPDGIAVVFGEVTGAHFDRDKLVEDLGRRWLIDEPFLKLSSSCRETQGALAVLEALLAEGPVDPRAIEAITVTTFAPAAALKETGPVTAIGARFSIPFVLALRLCYGSVWIEAFAPERLQDPAIRALAARVRVVEDPAMTALLPAQRPCRLDIRLADGSVRTAQETDAPGDPVRPLPESALRDKFLRMTGEAGLTGGAAAWDGMMQLAKIADFGAFSRLFAQG